MGTHWPLNLLVKAAEFFSLFTEVKVATLSMTLISNIKKLAVSKCILKGILALKQGGEERILIWFVPADHSQNVVLVTHRVKAKNWQRYSQIYVKARTDPDSSHLKRKAVIHW